MHGWHATQLCDVGPPGPTYLLSAYLKCLPEQAQEEQGSYASGEETEPLAFGTQLVREGD